MKECVFIILGATGDLAKRKLIPAIYNLIEEKKIDKFAVIGAAIQDFTSDKVLGMAKKFVKNCKETTWKKLEKNFYYEQLDFYDFQGYLRLKERIKLLEKNHSLKANLDKADLGKASLDSGKHLFYLATMPEHFSIITDYLNKSGIVKRQSLASSKKWSRIVYEKPFGYDLKTSKAINKSVLKVFDESQIYRIDHYLGKELVGDIALVRFTNRIFEPLWNNKHIDSVQIILSETKGITGRGKFYDATGAINDMIQSHMLEILALVCMEQPKELSGKCIRDAKTKVLKKVKVDSSVLGQYIGYKSETGVKSGSKTETFAAVKLFVNNRRWKGVPFYLKTGKYLKHNDVSIHIKFKMVKCLLSSCPSDSNYLTINIQPEEGFYLGINSKIPGKYEVTPVKMDFCHSCLFGPNTPQAYENLLLDVIRGDQSVFLRSDEIELSWKIVEKIKKGNPKIHRYKKGSDGPKENFKIGWKI